MRIIRQEESDYAVGVWRQNLRIGGRSAASSDRTRAYPLKLGVILSRSCVGKRWMICSYVSGERRRRPHSGSACARV